MLLLSLFDSHPPIAYNCYKDQAIDYKKIFPLVVANYFQLDDEYVNYVANNPDVTIYDVAAEIKKTKEYELPFDEDYANDFFTKWVFTHKMLKHHELKNSINAEGIIYKGISKINNYILSELQIADVEKEKWNDYFANAVKIFDTPGNHYTMFGTIENVVELAKNFSEHFKTINK